MKLRMDGIVTKRWQRGRRNNEEKIETPKAKMNQNYESTFCTLRARLAALILLVTWSVTTSPISIKGSEVEGTGCILPSSAVTTVSAVLWEDPVTPAVTSILHRGLSQKDAKWNTLWYNKKAHILPRLRPAGVWMAKSLPIDFVLGDSMGSGPEVILTPET